MYWRRRLALALFVVLVAGGVWWFVARASAADGADPSRSDAGATVPTAPSPSSGKTAPPAGHATGSKSKASRPQTSPRTSPDRSPATGNGPAVSRPARPSGPCDPATTRLELDVSDAEAGDANAATLLFSSTRARACTLDITAKTLAVRVTSGPDVVWSSEHCPDALRAKRIVVRSDPPTAYEFVWNGRRSAEGCGAVSELPAPGGYWVEAALIGGDPQRAFFDLT